MEHHDNRHPLSPGKERQSLETLLHYSFKDSSLLDRALTHSSLTHGARGKTSNALTENYERLEFLGDAILGFVIGEFLFRTYPSRNEGELTKMRAFLVSTKHLDSLSRQLDLGAFIKLSPGAEKTGVRTKPTKVLADLFESTIAAIYLDGGFECARDFILFQFQNSFKQVAKKVDFKDHKTLLQEILHKHNLAKPTYSIVDGKGPAKNKEFVVALHIQDRFLAHGTGLTKKEAQQNAAKQALGILTSKQKKPFP